MKNIFQLFRKNSTAIQLTAAAMIICMGLADASLYISYALGKRDAADDLRIVTEEKALDTAMADGHYSDNNSDSENKEEKIIETSEGKSLFNILEIVPDEKKGVVGYTIGGCEPFTGSDDKPLRGLLKTGGAQDEYLVTPAQMREAYMDALFNPQPGQYSADTQPSEMENALGGTIGELAIKNLNEGFSDSGPTNPIGHEIGLYNGYYKYVGTNNGVYRIVDPESSDPEIHSRFYETGRSDYNYIFVYSDANSTDTADVNVKNQKRIKYINNEKFLKDSLGLTGDAIQEFKDSHVIEVTTKNPESVTLPDIERADVIFVNNGNQKNYYGYAVNLNNLIHGRNKDTDKTKSFSDIDFDDFEKVIRIYERVVVREDVAFIAEKLTAPNDPKNQGVTTNMHKLMVMLFYVQKGGEDAAGRELFTDYLKRYTSNPGKEYMALRKLHEENPEKYPTDYRAMSLRTTDDKTDYRYYYMHYNTPFHVGHPLVLGKGNAITGGYFDENGDLQPTYDGNAKQITLKRFDTFMYTDGGLHEKQSIDDDGYYSTQIQVVDNSNRYRQESNPWSTWYVADPNGEYVLISGQEVYNQYGEWQKYVKDDTVRYKDETVYCYDNAYESMSNTTDFVYIANDGKLVIDDKYSSNLADDKKKYWFRIDYDGNVGDGFAFRRRLWTKEELTTWPWDENLSTFFMKRTDETANSYYCNMHMWYDYNGFRDSKDRITAKVNDNFGSGYTYKNSSFVQENELFKADWVLEAITNRKIKREETDDSHVIERAKKDYYISMNILNGDGVNETNPTAKNKTLYYNQYEKDDIVKYEQNKDEKNPNPKLNAKIPINIRIRSTGKLVSIRVLSDTGTVIANYDLKDLENNVGNKKLTCTGSGGKTLELTPDNTLDASGYPERRTAAQKTPIYTYEGVIYDVMSGNYLNKRNAKIYVELKAKVPKDDDGVDEKTIRDEITIVRRDFFMLD